MGQVQEMTKERRAEAIVATRSVGNLPHPHHPGKRIVGWIVDEELAGLSDALFAMDVIRDRFNAGSEVAKIEAAQF